MPSYLRRVLREARRARDRLPEAEARGGFARYRDDPVGYCRDVLRVSLTPDQEYIARLVTTPPYKVLVRAGHNVGKSFLAACLVCWWYDTRDPGVVLTTAPVAKQVSDILWKEVRRLRRRAGLGGFPGPKIPRLESAPDHFAHGFTARDAHSFQGQHEAAVFIVFDEAEGIDPIFWEAAETMLGGDSYGMFAIYNPTTTTAQTAEEERTGGWHKHTLSALNHPNIRAELEGLPPPVPSAIRLARLEEQLAKWSEEVPGPEPGAVELRGRWYRPGLIAQARLLGVRPSQGFDAIWSEAAVDRAEATILPPRGRVQIGADIAWYGDDCSAFHVRRGGCSLHHESHNGWATTENAERLKALAYQFGREQGVDPRQVVIAVDVIGYGAGVYDVLAADGWNAAPVNVAGAAPESTVPDDPGCYNLRAALWFGLAEEAARGNVSWARLSREVKGELRRQFTAVRYSLDRVYGRRIVEDKADTKARLKRSPDDADSVLLAFANVAANGDRQTGYIPVARHKR